MADGKLTSSEHRSATGHRGATQMTCDKCKRLDAAHSDRILTRDGGVPSAGFGIGVTSSHTPPSPDAHVADQEVDRLPVGARALELAPRGGCS